MSALLCEGLVKYVCVTMGFKDTVPSATSWQALTSIVNMIMAAAAASTCQRAFFSAPWVMLFG